MNNHLFLIKCYSSIENEKEWIIYKLISLYRDTYLAYLFDESKLFNKCTKKGVDKG